MSCVDIAQMAFTPRPHRARHHRVGRVLLLRREPGATLELRHAPGHEHHPRITRTRTRTRRRHPPRARLVAERRPRRERRGTFYFFSARRRHGADVQFLVDSFVTRHSRPELPRQGPQRRGYAVLHQHTQSQGRAFLDMYVSPPATPQENLKLTFFSQCSTLPCSMRQRRYRRNPRTHVQRVTARTLHEQKHSMTLCTRHISSHLTSLLASRRWQNGPYPFSYYLRLHFPLFVFLFCFSSFLFTMSRPHTTETQTLRTPHVAASTVSLSLYIIIPTAKQQLKPSVLHMYAAAILKYTACVPKQIFRASSLLSCMQGECEPKQALQPAGQGCVLYPMSDVPISCVRE